MTPALPELVVPVLAIAREAAARILDIYQRGFEISEKADRSPVTEADMAAHHCIVEGLEALTPDIPVLSEESAAIPYARRRQWDWFWLVDPLDGTRQFIKRNDEFSVNIALVHGQMAVFGLILAPVGGACYFGWRRGGAYKQAPLGPPRPIHTRPARPDAIRVAGSRSFTGRPMQTYLELLGKHTYLGMGSALKSCLVAEGQVDIFATMYAGIGRWLTCAITCP